MCKDLDEEIGKEMYKRIGIGIIMGIISLVIIVVGVVTYINI